MNRKTGKIGGPGMLVLLLLLGANAVTADYEFESGFGSFGSAPGQFDDPRGVAVNGSGNILVAESGNNRMQVCSDSGDCTAFGSPGVLSGEFDKPRGVAVNSQNRIIIADRGNDRIQNCNLSGSCTDFDGSGAGVGEFESPRGVAITSQDRIVVTDTDNDRVQICTNTNPEICTGFGSTGSSLGQFSSPAGVAVDSQGRLIIADRGNDRIQICTEQGSCTAFGSFGTAPGQFDSPAGIAVDSQDRIIVVDRFNDRVQVCSDQGVCGAFGSFGTGDGQLNEPWGVAVDSQDRIIVADLGNNRIQIFSEQGTSNPVVIDSFTAIPDTIVVGQTVTISWSVSNATGCAPTNGAGGWSGLTIDPSSGNTSVMIDTVGTFTFTLECSGDGMMDSASVDVTVTETTNPVVINSFTAMPGTIEMGQSVAISWSVSNASGCTATNGAGGWSGLTIDPSGGNTNLTINTVGTFTFTLECSGNGTMDSSSIDVIVESAQSPFVINVGITDAWFFPVTSGQGFFIIVWDDIKTIFLAWFTYDVDRPPEDISAILGEPGHRWITAQGPFEGDTATLDVFVSSGGVFNSDSPAVETSPDGTMVIQFSGCNEGLVSYHIESLNLSGEVPIERIVLDKVPLCEALNQEAVAQ